MRPIVYMGGVYDQSGYGMVVRNYILGLHKLGCDITSRPIRFWNGQALKFNQEDADILTSLEKKPLPQNNDWLFVEHVTADNYIYDERAYKHIGYTPFETDGLPAHWVLSMKGLDEIYVPSKFNVETYGKYGIDKTKIIPHGVDTDKFNPEGGKLDLGDLYKKFRFGASFDWNPRKCPESIIEAYTKMFSKSDETVLIIKTFFQLSESDFKFNFGISTDEYIKRIINNIRTKYDKVDNPPMIYIMRQILDDDVLPLMYRSMDCMITVSRGEGWGLGSSESLASEVPTIATKWSGNLEFMNENNSYLVNAKIDRIPETWLNHFSKNYIGRQSWANPDIDELAYKMKYVYENYNEAKDKAKQGRKDMIEKYTWNKVCEKYYKELEKY